MPLGQDPQQIFQMLMNTIQPAISHQQQPQQPIYRRSDNSIKGQGWLGMMLEKEPETPTPGEDMLTRTGFPGYPVVSSELSVGPGIGIPTMVPTLDNNQVRQLQSLKYGQQISPDIIKKAQDFNLHQRQTHQPSFINDPQLEYEPGMNPELDRLINLLKVGR